jgi:CPA1 family monovalent cation:H+ antiporter
VSQRVVAMLDGESLLNDATALVLLRTAIVATAASFSFWGALGTFAYSVVVATVGMAVGWLNLVVVAPVRSTTAARVSSPQSRTVAISATRRSGSRPARCGS